jgi:hypothetical protein
MKERDALGRNLLHRSQLCQVVGAKKKILDVGPAREWILYNSLVGGYSKNVASTRTVCDKIAATSGRLS